MRPPGLINKYEASRFGIYLPEEPLSGNIILMNSFSIVYYLSPALRSIGLKGNVLKF
jgi:hypothetical protein